MGSPIYWNTELYLFHYMSQNIPDMPYIAWKLQSRKHNLGFQKFSGQLSTQLLLKTVRRTLLFLELVLNISICESFLSKLRLRQNGCHSADGIFKYAVLNEKKFEFQLKFP